MRRRVFLVVGLLTLGVPRALRARGVAAVRQRRAVRRADPGRRRAHGRRRHGAGTRDVRDAVPRHDPRGVPHARRGARGRRARAAAAGARAPGTAGGPCCSAASSPRRACACAYVVAVFLATVVHDVGVQRLVAGPGRRARGPARAGGGGDRARCRSPARWCSPRRRTASPCSCSSARASPPGCSARSARRWARTRSTGSRTIASWALPFEALYQSALSQLTTDTVGFTRLAIDLGPFGGAQSPAPRCGPTR